MNDNTHMQALLRDNISLALGCTEPVAVALAAAKTKEVLGRFPEKLTLKLSKNIIKNAMGVGIPGTDMIGLPIAIALGVVAGKSSDELAVLSHCLHAVEDAKKWLKQANLAIECKETTEKLYIECIGEANGDTAKVIICQTHTRFSHIEHNGEILSQYIDHEAAESKRENGKDAFCLSLRKIYDYATTAPLQEIEWILETAKENLKASDEGLRKAYGLQLGRVLYNAPDSDIRKRVIGRTCAAIDARMDGATTPVYSNSGSGNQGLTCSLPIYTFAVEKNIEDKSQIIRALTLCHLVSIYIKQHIGRLSALCGVVNASVGISCGMLYLQNGTYEQMCFAVRNIINSITGMLCDGAKPSCSLKVSAGIHAAFDAVELAMNHIVVDETDGLAEHDVDRSILNLAKIGAKGMNETDSVILDIMTHKQLQNNNCQ